MSRFLIRDPRELLLRPTRRNVLQGAGALAGATALGLGTGASMAQDNVLNILTWPGHGDPAFVKPCEDEHGVKVVAKEYVGGEPMLALMNTSCSSIPMAPSMDAIRRWQSFSTSS